ncbi:MAG: hypothetical protein ACE5KM_13795 [Planctomycetaceae bacterium]
MGFEIGLDAKTYRNTGTWGIPTFDEISNIQEVTTTLDASEAEAKARGLTYTEFRRGIINAVVNITMLYSGADTDFVALRDAFLNDTLIELYIADGLAATSGTQGLRGEFTVLSMERGEPLEEGLTVVFSVKPRLGATNKPINHVIP